MTKIQLTLTDKEAQLLTMYGEQFGYNTAKTAKFIVQKATEQIFHQSMPTFMLSKKQEGQGITAIQEHRNGNTIPFSGSLDFLD
ncbi:MAG: hypothetical protein H6774_01920 [Pseudomonadales bacterium]|nr:hypothetical protein [Candidatus Woesebacteria bacterium]MCB9801823.1 hypothetical protein [Pseudomonadales bacterium]